MQTNSNPNPHYVPTTAGAETAKKLQLNQKQLALFLIPIACLIGIGIFGVMGGFISTSASTSADSTRLDLAPPEAKLKAEKGDEKYDKEFSPSDLNPNRSGANAIDQHAAQNSEMLTGQNPKQRLGSNEHLPESDWQEMGQRNNMLKYASPTDQKQFQKRQFTQQNQRQLREQQRVLNTLYRSPKSREQLTEDRQNQADRDFNRRATETVLRQIEMANQRNNGGDSPTPSAEPLMSKEYLTLKKTYGGELPAEYRTLFKKEIEAENKGLLKNGAEEPNTLILTETQKKATDGFYGTNKVKTNAQSAQTNHAAIEAVIHGDGDKVVVENGSTLKIRLTETVQLLLNGERVTLPTHTLLAGNCQINGERISVTISNIRLGMALYQTNLTVYDLDGRVGLYVPKIREKNLLANGLGQSAQTAVSSPSFFIQQGSLGQQVGTQMALQAGNSLFSGVRAYAQAKMANVKVTVNRSGDPPQLQNPTQTHRTE
jgi:hypothetical protein